LNALALVGVGSLSRVSPRLNVFKAAVVSGSAGAAPAHVPPPEIAYPLETGAIKHEKTRGQALSAPVVIINDSINDTINDIIQNVIGDNVGWCRHSLMRRIVHGTCCSLFCR
jgi:hypothetical protein